MSEPGSATTAPGDESAAPTEMSSGPEAGPEAGPEGEVRAAPEPQPASRPWWVRRYTFTGTAVGLIFIWFSMTPSLLPRTALFQGLVSGVSGAIGYGLGVFSVWLVRYMRSKDSSPPAPVWAWKALFPIGVVGMVVMAIRFHLWQDDVRDLMGVKHLEWYDYPEAAILSLVML
ncbi:MAG TPA: alpha/beta-hydrolase N-terminal domain-containing protein, partial [Mycobacterium sp.]|nr:alpha/beta-hydrolase N-terminal domain-containing protein [Mycobacterium sp.]